MPGTLITQVIFSKAISLSSALAKRLRFTPPPHKQGIFLLVSKKQFKNTTDPTHKNLINCHIGFDSAGPAACDIDPFRETRAVFALDFDNVSVTAAPAANTVLLFFVPSCPVFILQAPVLFWQVHIVPGLATQLTCWRIGWTMLDCGMSISNVTEVMDILHTEQSTGGKGVNRGVPPL